MDYCPQQAPAEERESKVSSPSPQRLNASEDEIDPSKEIRPVIVTWDMACYAARKWILSRVELRPRGRHCLQEIGSTKTLRSGELQVGGVLPAHAKDVCHQRAHCRPPLPFRHAKSANLLAYAFDNVHDGRNPRDTCERGTHPRMLVDHVEQRDGDRANRRLRCRDRYDLIQRARNDCVAGSGEQVGLISDVPINSSRPGGESFGQSAEGKAFFSAAVQ